MALNDRLIAYCPKCGECYATLKWNSDSECKKCHTPLFVTDISEEEWDRLPESEKDQYRKKFKEGNTEENHSESCEVKEDNKKAADNDELLEHIRRIDHDVHFMYVLSVIAVVCGILGGVIALAMACAH